MTNSPQNPFIGEVSERPLEILGFYGRADGAGCLTDFRSLALGDYEPGDDLVILGSPRRCRAGVMHPMVWLPGRTNMIEEVLDDRV